MYTREAFRPRTEEECEDSPRVPRVPALPEMMDRWLAETVKEGPWSTESYNSTIYAYPARRYVPGENRPWELETGRVTTQPSRSGSRRPGSRASPRANGSRTIGRARSRVSGQSDCTRLANTLPTEPPVHCPRGENSGSSSGQQHEALVRGEEHEITPTCPGNRQNPYPIHGSSTPDDGYFDPQLLQCPREARSFSQLDQTGAQTAHPENGNAYGDFVVQCVGQASNEPVVSQNVGIKKQGDTDRMFEEWVDCSMFNGDE